MTETTEYILNSYPDLFMIDRKGKIYLSDPLKSIYDGQIFFQELSIHVDIGPMDQYTSNNFTFRLILPKSSISSVERSIYLNDDIVLTDQQCALFFKEEIDIDTKSDDNGWKRTYDRQSIMRKYTIENIIKQDE